MAPDEQFRRISNFLTRLPPDALPTKVALHWWSSNRVWAKQHKKWQKEWRERSSIRLPVAEHLTSARGNAEAARRITSAHSPCRSNQLADTAPNLIIVASQLSSHCPLPPSALCGLHWASALATASATASNRSVRTSKAAMRRARPPRPPGGSQH
eukprot:scaffold310822_cov28-Tisochrysis_lutea.AAC.2